MLSFNKLHPVVLAIYFLSVMLVTMFSTNPILIGLALLSGIVFCRTMESGSTFFKDFIFYLILFVLIAITNPLFSHNGVTPLFFINGNAVTLEAILYGIDIAAMLIAIMYWFKCFNNVMTSEKLLFLFGKFSPKIALILSSALRFIPLFKVQAKKIKQASKAMGLYSSESWISQLKGMIRVFSSLVTWSFENAIDTGSSMKARGYGLKGRSHFSIFRFTFSDGILITFIILLDFIVFNSMAKGSLEFSFYPRVSELEIGINTLLSLISFGVLCFIPVILEVKENIKWKYYKSKI